MKLTVAAMCVPTVLAAQFPESSEPADSDPMNPSEIISRVVGAYGQCKSYRDSGTSVTRFVGKRPSEEQIEFKTVFRRPEAFRFEYRAKLGDPTNPSPGFEDRMIVHRDKSGVHTWWSIEGGSESPKSLSLALAGATGVSSGTAHTIPVLLMPLEIGGRSLGTAGDWSLLSEESEGGVPCCRLKRSKDKGTETIWIDKARFLILRLDDTHKFDDYDTERTTRYSPEIDVDIPDVELTFNLP